MFESIPYKTKQFLIAIIKLSIIVGATYYIYNKLLSNPKLNFSEFASFLVKNDTFSVKNVLFLLFLSIFNWFFEILKWQKLVNSIKKITFFEALEQSLGGHTASLITPNRIGDYGAKSAYYSRTHRKQIVLLNLLANMNQMAVTTLFGILGLVTFYKTYEMELNYYKISRFLIIICAVGLFTIFGVKQSKVKIKGFSIERVINYLKNIPYKIHRHTFLLSVFRYATFSFQFYLLLQIFGVDIDYYTAMVAISSMYFLSSIIPTLAAFDVLIKTSAAVFLFSFLDIDELTILSVSTTMWLLNFILPSVFGSYFVINFQLPKTED
ncbi:MAG: hypothetical protein ED556_00605 [Winogradskyella sp.]|uniref:lysylphosphatidylglycerol synthase domain-containing protein n=1 Tax=Winogradskyella sp. TaxID=1883156 RepID=UPI000F3CB487|nr:lysylphosphatidylglycerol synthase domain-containing protein [Winogradskyella sp.]RNC87722.1 MAG: hypothetical protein ED556_00605 [Winogradskyella sp.]